MKAPLCTRSAAAVALLAAVALGGAGCTGEEPAEAATKTLRVGIKYDQPGVGMMVDGVPTGFDVDVAAYVAWKLGHSPYAIEWVETVSANREKYLQEGKVDFIVATFSISPEREKVVDFAGPYIVAGQDLMVRADDTAIAGPDNLAGKKVCTAKGASSLTRLKKLLGDTATIVAVERLSDCVTQLVDGKVDAMSTDDLILAGYAATDEVFGDVRLVGKTFSQEQLGIGLPQGSTALCEKINAALVEMVDDGSWQKFIDRHTGGTGYTPNAKLNPPKPAPCA